MVIEDHYEGIMSHNLQNSIVKDSSGSTCSPPGGGTWIRVCGGLARRQPAREELPRPLCSAPHPTPRLWSPLDGRHLSSGFHWWFGAGIWRK